MRGLAVLTLALCAHVGCASSVPAGPRAPAPDGQEPEASSSFAALYECLDRRRHIFTAAQVDHLHLVGRVCSTVEYAPRVRAACGRVLEAAARDLSPSDDPRVRLTQAHWSCQAGDCAALGMELLIGFPPFEAPNLAQARDYLALACAGSDPHSAECGAVDLIDLMQRQPHPFASPVAVQR